MLDFCGEHNITADVEVIPIQKVNEAYERLVRSDVKYRFSIDMASLKGWCKLAPTEADIAKLCPQATVLDGLAVRGGKVKAAHHEVAEWVRRLPTQAWLQGKLEFIESHWLRSVAFFAWSKGEKRRLTGKKVPWQ
jgi:hypothetical protein